ncbi:CRTAC1 family protein [Halovulum dunhuangense]
MRAALFLLLWPAVLQAGPRFQDVSADLPVAHVYDGGWEHFVGGGVAVFDCNGDALPEFLAAGGENPARLFVNRGGMAFVLGNGIPQLDGVTGAYPLDIDSDGLLDLAVLRVGPNLLLKGMGDCRFEDRTTEWGFDPGDRWSTAFSATWEPGQDWPTLAVGNYVDRSDPAGPFEACDANTLHRPDGTGYATPILLEPGFCALSILFSDRMLTGRADLRVSNDRHYYVRGGSEQMWRMEPLALMGPEEGWQPISIWGMGIASRDLNGDRLPEVVLTSMGDQLMLIAQPDGSYRGAPYDIGTYAQRPHVGDDGRPATGWHAEFADVDNDGRDDLFIAKGNVDQMPTNAMRDPNNLLMQGPDGRFTEASVEAGVATVERARGASLADFDGDGRLDLVVVNRRAPLELYRNVTSDTGNWLALEPRQAGPNGFAVGAFLEVETPGGVTHLREITVGGGHVGGQAGPQHFGLGPDTAAKVRVRWPDGGVSDWVGVEANRRLSLWRDGAGLDLR